ncbi:MAG: hypothetical protein KGN78_01380 [Actinomycetales bacterium]|nr:hypothetical protein [Actinomycetales bacterium]
MASRRWPATSVVLRNSSAGLVLLGILAATATGCSETPGGADCDVVGLEHEIDHIVGEAGLELESLGDVSCVDNWALVQATVGAPGIPSASEPYLFARSEGMWVLKAPETACGTVVDDNRPADAEIPEGLWEQTCLGQ